MDPHWQPALVGFSTKPTVFSQAGVAEQVLDGSWHIRFSPEQRVAFPHAHVGELECAAVPFWTSQAISQWGWPAMCIGAAVGQQAVFGTKLETCVK